MTGCYLLLNVLLYALFLAVAIPFIKWCARMGARAAEKRNKKEDVDLLLEWHKYHNS